MKKGFIKTMIVLVCLICGLAFVCVACKKNQSDEADTNAAGTIIVSCEGTVYLEDASGNRKEIAAGDVIGNGDILVTEEDGKVVVSLYQKGKVYLEENTRLEFVLEGNKLELFVAEGKILVDAQEPLEGIEKLTVHTAAMTADVLGSVVFIENQTQMDGSANSVLGVLKGKAEVSYTGLDNPPTKISAGEKSAVQYQKEEKEVRIKNVTDSKISQEDLADYEGIIQTAGLSDQVRSILENNADKKPDDSKKESEEKEKNKNDGESAKVENNYVIPNYPQPIPVSQIEPSENTPTVPEETEQPITTAVIFTSGSATKVYDGTALSDSAISVTGMPDGYNYSATCAASITDAGSTENIIRDIQIVDANGKDVTKLFTNITKTNGVLTVTPAEVTITTGSASKVYDGEALSCEDVTITGLANGETASVTATGSITDAGTADNTYTIDWGNINLDNYTVTEDIGTLTVEALEMNVQWKIDGPVEYAGLAYTAFAGDVSVTYQNGPYAGETILADEGEIVGGSNKIAYLFDLFTGDQITVFADGEGRNVGTYSISLSTEAPKEKTGDYSFTYNADTLEITQVELIVKIEDTEKTYDGKPLTPVVTIYRDFGDECLPISSDGKVYFGENEIQFTGGSITDVEETTATYSVNWGIHDSDNFILQEELGTLKVTPAALTIKTGSASKLYDGKALTYSEDVEISGLANGESITVTATGSITDEGEAENTCQISWDNAKEGNYSVTKKPGTLTIFLIYITAASEEKEYDGEALESSDYSVTNLPEGWNMKDVVVSGSQTEVGEGVNEIVSYTLLDSAGMDVTETYKDAVVCLNGVLTVEEAARTGMYQVIWGAVLSRQSMKVAFPDLGETYALQNCTYETVLAAAESNATPNDYSHNLKQKLFENGWITTTAVENGTIDSVSVNPDGYEAFPEGSGVNTVYYSTAGGVVVSKDVMKAAFPELGEVYDLKCSYREARSLLEGVYYYHSDLTDKQFQILFRNQLKEKGWI